MNLYSVSRINLIDKSETVIAEGLECIEVARLVKTEHTNVPGFANRNGIANGIYRISIYGETERGDINKSWFDICAAAELIKTGRGRIETRFINGKRRKVTVRI